MISKTYTLGDYIVNVIMICMGSSCFSRGNVHNAEFIKRYIVETGQQDNVALSGCLCRNACKKGPNIIVDENMISQVSPGILPDLLDQLLGNR
ncbi:MAG: (2Fe-2S) ferredoxin domain-containing protein [Treponema sp.]|jgi:NADH:ubiquinone oxidoreductase subunit E|nr:(2Fe-2S) ferredoxin domain-containing protein [Treponema sp.]